jgi:hypothetical protein
MKSVFSQIDTLIKPSRDALSTQRVRPAALSITVGKHILRTRPPRSQPCPLAPAAREASGGGADGRLDDPADFDHPDPVAVVRG